MNAENWWTVVFFVGVAYLVVRAVYFSNKPVSPSLLDSLFQRLRIDLRQLTRKKEPPLQDQKWNSNHHR